MRDLKLTKLGKEAMSELRKINKRSKYLIIFMTLFSLASVHLSSNNLNFANYISIMIAITIMTFMTFTSEWRVIQSWDIIAKHHDTQDEMLESIAKLTIENINLREQLHIRRQQ